MKILRTACLGSNFTGYYKKECVCFRYMWSLALSIRLCVVFLLENVNYMFLDYLSDVFDFHEYEF